MKAAEYFNGTFENLPELTAQEADQLKELFYKYQSLSPEDMFYFAAIAKLFINDPKRPKNEANNQLRDLKTISEIAYHCDTVQGITINGINKPILSEYYQKLLGPLISTRLLIIKHYLHPYQGRTSPRPCQRSQTTGERAHIMKI